MRVKVLGMPGCGPVNFGRGIVANRGDEIDLPADRARSLEKVGVVEILPQKCGAKLDPRKKPPQPPVEEDPEPVEIIRGLCNCCAMMPTKEGANYRCPRDNKLHVKCKYWRE
jgi:hypothetical protein